MGGWYGGGFSDRLWPTYELMVKIREELFQAYILCTNLNERGDHMAAYIIARIDVTDWDRYKEYMKVTPGVIEKFGGRFIVRGGEMATLEGAEETRRIVVLEFPSLEEAKEFYYSKEYAEAKKLREGAATASFIAIDGVQQK